MKKFTKSVLAAAVYVSITGTQNLAMAQENNDSEQTSEASNALIEQILVVGTKKSGGESLQESEVAISAFGEELIEAYQVRSISDLSFKTPNVQLDDIGTTKGTANFSVRGLGVNSSIPSIEPAVGVFVDGVYLGINTGVVFDTFDLASVEVLRGPQGVLFGRNVTGGAVLLNTGDPTDYLYVKAKVAVESGFRGTGENYYTSGVISGPLSDSVNGKIGVYYNNDRGWHENLFDGSNFGISNTTLLRGALEYTDNEGFSLLGKLEYGDSSGDGPAAQSHQNGSGVNSFATNILGDPSQTFDRDSFDFAVNTRGLQETDWINFSLKGEWDVDFGDGLITNIFGYRDYQQLSISDIDASIVSVFDAAFNVNQDQISNELRYNGSFHDDRLEVTAGLFFFQQDLIYEEQRRVTGTLNFDGGGIIDQQTLGVFASVDYAFTEKFSVNAGLRFSDETKEADIAQIEISADNTPCFIFSGGASDRLCQLTEFETFETSNLSPKIGFGYEALDNLRFYGSWSRAFRAGGFNLRNTENPTSSVFFGAGPFEDEQIDSFELGLKSEPVNGARLNVSVFYSELEDLQREVNVAGGTAVVLQVITNAADANIYGIEADFQWPITDDFFINGSIGLLESEFTDVTLNLTAASDTELGDPAGDDDLALNLPRLAPVTGNLGFTYFIDVGDNLITVNANYSHRDETPFTDNNLGFVNAQNRFDASIGFDIGTTGYNITLYGKNLSDEVLHGGDTQLSNGTFSPLAKGRVIGIELIYEL